METLRKLVRYVYVSVLLVSVFVASFMFGGDFRANNANETTSLLEGKAPFAYADAPAPPPPPSKPPAPVGSIGSAGSCGSSSCSSSSSN